VLGLKTSFPHSLAESRTHCLIQGQLTYAPSEENTLAQEKPYVVFTCSKQRESFEYLKKLIEADKANCHCQFSPCHQASEPNKKLLYSEKHM